MFYLIGDQVHLLLGTLSGLVVAGSWLLTDAVSESFLVSAQLGGFLAMMAENGSPFRFGMPVQLGQVGLDRAGAVVSHDRAPARGQQRYSGIRNDCPTEMRSGSPTTPRLAW